jgi:Flp pilus assembly protein TadG
MVIKNWIGSLRQRTKLSQAETGQSLIILALAFLGLIAMLGLALDLGVLYIERIHLKRAVDAAALAGVVELPNEEAAMTRAIEYLRANDYNIPNPDGSCSANSGICDVSVKVVGCARTDPTDDDFSTLANTAVPRNYITVANPRATFILDTYTYQASTRDCAAPSGHGSNATSAVTGSANKLVISGTVTVGMNFMQFFGYSTAPASDVAAAQNITNLDIAVVFDNSGSMEGDTVCYDCWHENTNDVINYPFPKNGSYQPISYTAMINNSLCSATSTPYAVGSNRYIIMEAELYSRNVNGSWARRQAGQGYWAIQRGNTDEPRASSIDGAGAFATGGNRSAYVAHHPYWTYGQSSPPAPLLGRFYTLQDAQSDAAPRLDYDFTPTWDGDAYIWIRAEGGGYQSFWVNQVGNSFQRDANKVYWAADSNVPAQNASAQTCDHTYTYAGCYNPTIVHDDFDCASGSSACKNRWSWIRLGSVPVTAGSLHTLKLWAGSPGYAIDKIVITNNSAANANGLNDALTANSNRGRPATQGSARGGAPTTQAGACDPCNPIFGLTVNPSDCTTPYYLVDEQTNNLGDPLFGDREPVRSSIEATKRFVMKLDPQYDQASFVGFDSNVNEQSELTCLRRQTLLGNPTACYAGTSAISFTNVLQRLENQTASGGTNIGEAMRNGLETLGYNVDSRSGVDNLCDGSANSACGRGGSKRVMILLTDGSPNTYTSGSPCYSDPNSWPYNSDRSFDCTMYYAKKAHQANTVIYTIGLGNGVIPELLKAVADETNGTYYWASSPDKLDAIFDQILSNIYVRLIQ